MVNNNDYQWKTGIHKIELLENGNWIEYYDEKGKKFTKFTLRDKEENTFYSFEMDVTEKAKKKIRKAVLSDFPYLYGL